MSRSPVQGVLPKYLKTFIVSKVNSESEQVRGPNERHVHHYQRIKIDMTRDYKDMHDS
jgi:hypothetical protein